jgi:hypothetical protein
MNNPTPDVQPGPLPTSSGPASYTLHTNVDRTILLTVWPNSKVEIAFRDHPSATWGPPITLQPTT